VDSLTISPNLAAPLPTARPHSTPAKIHEAAEQFEALLLGQILESAHPKGGWLGGGDDDAGGTAVSFAEQQLASTMARHGGIGLGKLIAQGLEKQS
jgi:flagellar protein FlgJ